MNRRRLAFTAAACVLSGLVINFAVAALLGARGDQAIVPTGFGFIDQNFAPTVGWAGDFGRDRLSVAAMEGRQRDSMSALEARFRSIFGKPNGSYTRGELDRWSARLFPRWGAWAYGVEEGERAIFATGFPLRSFAGYVSASRSASPMLSGKGGPAPALHEVGVLWRGQGRPIRCVPWIPLPVGMVVNTVVFAAPVFVVVMFPAWRRWRRVRRGHCPLCDYDLRGEFSRACSECGRVCGDIAARGQSKG